jgi:hypothetical protein
MLVRAEIIKSPLQASVLLTIWRGVPYAHLVDESSFSGAVLTDYGY